MGRLVSHAVLAEIARSTIMNAVRSKINQIIHPACMCQWHPIIMRTGLLTSSVLNLIYSPQIDTFVCGLTE